MLRQPARRAAASSRRRRACARRPPCPRASCGRGPGRAGSRRRCRGRAGARPRRSRTRVGRPSVISVHEWPPSSLRCMPTWFCWYMRSGRRASARACGRRSRPPRARAASRRAGPCCAASSSCRRRAVSNSADALHDRPEVLRRRPRSGIDRRDAEVARRLVRRVVPALAARLARRASSAATSVSPPSSLSKMPGASAPTSTRPSVTASDETFETLRSPSSS